MAFPPGKPEDRQTGEAERSAAPQTDAAMGCEEALRLWHAELAGVKVERTQMEQALTHIARCEERCAEELAASPVDEIERIARISGHADVYEALGSYYEAEGDAHHRRYRRLRALFHASPESLERERALALENWEEATKQYQSGLRLFSSAFLTDALKRMQRKPVLPPVPRPALQRRFPTLAQLLYQQENTSLTQTQMRYPREIDPFTRSPGESYSTSVLAVLLPSAPEGQPQMLHASEQWSLLAPTALPSFARQPEDDLSGALEAWSRVQRDLLRVEGRVGPFALALAVAASEAAQWDMRVLVQPRLPDARQTSVLLQLSQAGEQPQPLRVFASPLSEPGVWSGSFDGIAAGSYHLGVAARPVGGEWVVADIELALAQDG